jgi:hypothetical protein
MVKVLMTGAEASKTPRGLAAARLHTLHGSSGTYQHVLQAPAVDKVSFLTRAQVGKQQQAETRWNFLNAAAKRATKIGAVFAGSLIGGIFGGFPGMLLGALLTAGLLSLRSTLRSKRAEAPAISAETPVNPFKSLELSHSNTSPEGVTPRELAKERLHAERFGATVEAPTETKTAPSATVHFNGRELVVKNLVSGMLPKSLNPFSDMRPALRFKTSHYIRTSELAQKAEILPTAALHNVNESLALVMLGKTGTTINVFEPNAAKPLTTMKESLSWGVKANAS